MAWRIGVVAMLLGGCASIEPSAFNGPNGRPAYSMGCSGIGRSPEACFKRAGELCQAGYSIISNDTQYMAWGGQLIPRNTIAVECK